MGCRAISTTTPNGDRWHLRSWKNICRAPRQRIAEIRKKEAPGIRQHVCGICKQCQRAGNQPTGNLCKHEEKSDQRRNADLCLSAMPIHMYMSMIMVVAMVMLMIVVMVRGAHEETIAQTAAEAIKT